MSVRISKLSKELNVGISVIAEYLNNNGYDITENHNQKVSEDAVELLKNNIYAYLREKSGKEVQAVAPDKPDVATSLEAPVEIKLIDCVSRHKLLIENIIGFTDYLWDYSVAKFHGSCSQPVKFTAFDEAISKLLLVKDMSLAEIGHIMGFDISDEAEKDILLSAVYDLRSDDMLSGNETRYRLTDTGRKYAWDGVKFCTFERDFELYIDATSGYAGNCRHVFQRLKSQKQAEFVKSNLPMNLKDVKPLAEIQAPEIHFPEKNYILQSCKPTGIEGYKAKVWVVLLENFRDQTVRTLVYDEEHDCIVEELSGSLNSNEELKQSIFDKLIDKDKEINGISYTDEEKDASQIEAESALIKEQQDYEMAVDSNDLSKAEEIAKKAVTAKHHFNSVEFEVELKRLFDETECELWIISPWIKINATMHRLPFFENYLKKGGKIFIAYSKPENGLDEMADPEALGKLMELERKYQNFYICQLDAFHFKYVWVRGDTEGSWFYTGSFNILSFFVKKGFTKVRQEMMTKLDWGAEEEENFSKVKPLFGAKYMKEAKHSLNRFNNDADFDRKSLQEIKAVSFSKLKPFLGAENDNYNGEYQELLNRKEELLQAAGQAVLNKELALLSGDVQKASAEASIAAEKKKLLQSRLDALKTEFSENLEDMAEIQESIDSLKIRTFPSLPRGNHNKKRL